jgi:hypothetical protein
MYTETDLIEALHDHLTVMFDPGEDDLYWDSYECGDVDGMLDRVQGFHDPSDCPVCDAILSQLEA